jgi:D-lactate dehydrogenase
MKIVFLESNKKYETYFREKFKKEMGRHKFVFFDEELNERNIKKIINADVMVLFLGSSITKNICIRFPKLKYISTMSTGFDHIDIKACGNRGVKISNVPNYGEDTVAEHTFGLILALSRKIVDAGDKTRRDDFSLKGLEGFDLKGKTLGVIGPGNIGQNVIRIASGFQMKVIAYSPHKDLKAAKKLGFRYVSLERLLNGSDVITIHAPLVQGTRHLINMENVRKIKKGAYLINTSRGEIVETRALKYALDRGILAGAGLDVLEGEDNIKEEAELLGKNHIAENEWKTFIRNHLLLKKKNVIVTPHSAFYSKEAIERILDTTVENVKGFLKGKIRNKVA